jgi:hypothetical protein
MGDQIMSKQVIAVAFVALMAAPLTAQAQDKNTKEDERGISVVALKEAASGVASFVVRPAGGVQPGDNNANQNADNSAPAQLFVVRPPSGVQPSGDNANENAGNSTPVATFIVRPPSGVTPNGGGANSGGNGSAGQVVQIVAPPQGTNPTPAPVFVPVVVPEVTNPTPPRPTNIATAAPAPAPIAQINFAADRATIDGVHNGYDLYELLIDRGYRVTVRRSNVAGQYVLMAHQSDQRFAHLLVVDDEYGTVLKHSKINLATYANGYDARPAHQPVYVQNHRQVAENCRTGTPAAYAPRGHYRTVSY